MFSRTVFRSWWSPARLFSRSFRFPSFLASTSRLLTHWSACNPGRPWWRKREIVTDVCYWFLIPLVARFVRIGLMVMGAAYIYDIHGADDLIKFYDDGFGPLAAMPLWAQAIFFVAAWHRRPELPGKFRRPDALPVPALNRRCLCTSFTNLQSTLEVVRRPLLRRALLRVACWRVQCRPCSGVAGDLFACMGLDDHIRGHARRTPAQADTMTVNVDEAQVMKLPERVATIVIGNPLIADATLQSGGILVITGKGYGSTNLLALDRTGQVVMDKTVQVLGASSSDLVVVYKGIEREILQLRAGLRTPHHARRLAGLFHRHAGADRHPQPARRRAALDRRWLHDSRVALRARRRSWLAIA